jgi:uncharacterized protein DUF6941
MASEAPVVRHLIACLEIITDPASRNVTLRNLIHAIVRLPGEPFPCIREQMALYAVLTNGRGEHDLAVELAVVDGGTERTVAQTKPRKVDLGQDPTQVHGLPIPMRNVIFEHPGHYNFYLICDGQRIGQQQIEVR